jgi:hypothetical protein
MRRQATNFVFTTLLLCFTSCDRKSSGEIESKLSELEGILKSTWIQTGQIQGSLWELTPTRYGLIDSQHKKFVGFLKCSPPPQVGTAIVWDDDVYVVELVRLHTRKKDEAKIDNSDTLVERQVDVEVMVKFLSKLNPPAEPKDK